MAFRLSKAQLKEFLLLASDEVFYEFIEDTHPVDLLDIFYDDQEAAYQIFDRLPEWMMAAIIDEASDDEKFELLTRYSETKQTEIMQEMSSDELADLVGTLDEAEANKIFEQMSDEDAKDVRQLLRYDPETAGGIMATEFIAIKDNLTIKQALKYLQKEAPDAESAYYLFVVNELDMLKGVVSLRDLVISSFDTIIADIMNTNVYSVCYDLDQEEVSKKFQKYGFLAMPVTDHDGKMLGIVTVDDIMDIIREETTEDIHRLGGVGEGERVDGTLVEAIKSRTPWLFINLLTAIFASATIALFDATIQQVVILATFMPIVAGMGGNAGTQTLTLIVRGIALEEITGENAKRILLKELGVGLVTGLFTGIAMAFLGIIYSGKPIFGFVIGIAMILNMGAATLSGYLVPTVLKKLKVDPALASAIFVTTVTDVLGFFFFLGLATLFINYLI
ncbi:MAG TPA: magnesium transporter [Firmicutes bacterium]|nr:magnesium transporter [Bacillota bacterium]